MTQHKIVIDFVLNHVPDADQLLMLAELFQLSFDIRAAQVDPADNAFDDRRLIG